MLELWVSGEDIWSFARFWMVHLVLGGWETKLMLCSYIAPNLLLWLFKKVLTLLLVEYLVSIIWIAVCHNYIPHQHSFLFLFSVTCTIALVNNSHQLFAHLKTAVYTVNIVFFL
jgi:hypothetical protein